MLPKKREQREREREKVFLFFRGISFKGVGVLFLWDFFKWWSGTPHPIGSPRERGLGWRGGAGD